jgi:hypothetical protein
MKARELFAACLTVVGLAAAGYAFAQDPPTPNSVESSQTAAQFESRHISIAYLSEPKYINHGLNDIDPNWGFNGTL